MSDEEKEDQPINSRPVVASEKPRREKPFFRWRVAWELLRRHFGENQLLLRASALTYATLLSSVPFLAVLLSILRGLGVEDRVLPILVDRLRIGGDEPATVILSTVERLNPP